MKRTHVISLFLVAILLGLAVAPVFADNTTQPRQHNCKWNDWRCKIDESAARAADAQAKRLGWPLTMNPVGGSCGHYYSKQMNGSFAISWTVCWRNW